jgi:uncharacterized integral membrane protein (TIGR00697 family)
MVNIQKMDLVVALYIFGVLTAELLGGKTFPLTNFSFMHLNASVAIFVLPLLFTLTDIVVEVHGRARARSMVFAGLIVVALLILYVSLVTHLPASHRFASKESAYETIFRSSIQLAAASLVAFAASELLDVAIFSKLREKLGRRGLWLRNNLSNFVAMLADSAIFISLAFYSLHHSFSTNVTFLISLIIPYWLIKCFLSIVETPFVYLGVWWLRKPEKNYDS